NPHDGRMPSSQLDAVLNAWVVTAGGRSATGVRLPYPRKEGPRVGDMIGQRVDGAPGRQLECLDALRDLHCVDVNPEVGLAHEVPVAECDRRNLCLVCGGHLANDPLDLLEGRDRQCRTSADDPAGG